MNIHHELSLVCNEPKNMQMMGPTWPHSPPSTRFLLSTGWRLPGLDIVIISHNTQHCPRPVSPGSDFVRFITQTNKTSTYPEWRSFWWGIWNDKHFINTFFFNILLRMSYQEICHQEQWECWLIVLLFWLHCSELTRLRVMTGIYYQY